MDFPLWYQNVDSFEHITLHLYFFFDGKSQMESHFQWLLRNLSARRARRLERGRKNGSRKLKCCWELQKFVACHCHFCFARRRRRLLLLLMLRWRRIRAFYSWPEPRIQSQRRKIEQPTRPIATTTKPGSRGISLFQPLKMHGYCQISVLPLMQIPGATWAAHQNYFWFKSLIFPLFNATYWGFGKCV